LNSVHMSAFSAVHTPNGDFLRMVTLTLLCLSFAMQKNLKVKSFKRCSRSSDCAFVHETILLNTPDDDLSLFHESKRLLDLLKSSGKRNVIPPPAIPKISGDDLRSVLTTPHPSHFQALQETIFYGQAVVGTVDMWPLQLLDFIEKKKVQISAPGHDTSVPGSPSQIACGQEQTLSNDALSQPKLSCPNPPPDASIISSINTPRHTYQLKQIPVSYAPREVTHTSALIASLDKQKITTPEQIYQQSGTSPAALFNFEHNQTAAALKPVVALRNPKGSEKPHKPNRIQMPIPSSGGGPNTTPPFASNRQSKRIEGRK
jgi:hypothetical protein